MSHKLINLNSDLKRLRDEGYEIEILQGHLVVSHIPYVNSSKKPMLGTLVCVLGNILGDSVGKPPDHTIYFSGEIPCDKDGIPIKGLLNSSQKKKLTEGIFVDH